MLEIKAFAMLVAPAGPIPQSQWTLRKTSQNSVFKYQIGLECEELSLCAKLRQDTCNQNQKRYSLCILKIAVYVRYLEFQAKVNSHWI